MGDLLLNGPFSWREARAAVSIVLRGPHGYCHPKLCSALSKIQELNPSSWRKYANAFVWALNVTYRAHPCWADLFLLDGRSCQTAIDQLIAAAGIKTDTRRDRFQRIWLKPTAGQHRKIAEALAAIAQITAVLVDRCYGGFDPSLVNPAMQEAITRDAAAARAAGRGNGRRPCYNRVRIKDASGKRPRIDDPRRGEDWLKAASSLRIPEVFSWLVRWARGSGARGCSLRPLTLFDLLRGAARSGEASAPSKGSEGERTLTLVLNLDEYVRFELWLDGQLRKLRGVSLENIKRNLDKHSDDYLRSFPIFSEDGHNSIKREKLCRVFRKVSVASGMTYRARSGEGERPFTFHQLRHEYVFSRLMLMYQMPEERWAGEEKSIIDYMGWAGSSMLKWYSKHFDQTKAIRAAQVANNDLSGAELFENVWAASNDDDEGEDWDEGLFA